MNLNFAFKSLWFTKAELADYWKLSRKHPNASTKLGMACLGMCIHSTTDNSSYDMTLQSQLAWARQLGELDSIYFLSIVGTACDSADKASSIAFELRKSMLRKMPYEVAGVDTSDWMDEGFDGLLTARTQVLTTLPLLNLNLSWKGCSSFRFY